MERKKLPIEYAVAADVLNAMDITPDIPLNPNLGLEADVQRAIYRRIRRMHPAKLGVIVAKGAVNSPQDVCRELLECETLNGLKYMEIWAAAVVESAIRELIVDNNNRLAVG